MQPKPEASSLPEFPSVPSNQQQWQWVGAGQDVCQGAAWGNQSRYGVQGAVAPAASAPQVESTEAEASKRASKAPSTSPGKPTQLTEAPGHLHAKGTDSGPSVPTAPLEPGDATEVL